VANGSLLANREAMEHIPAFSVKSIDSTGAGDAFIGSFAVFPWGRPSRSERQCAGRISTLDFPPPVWELKNPSTAGRATTLSGPQEKHPSLDLKEFREHGFSGVNLEIQTMESCDV
jgi:sugar/nucleoside kinase (ribokinase family)